jgi:hypothetical protein
MAQAAALSLASRMAPLLNLDLINFLTDNQNLVTYLNETSQKNYTRLEDDTSHKGLLQFQQRKAVQHLQDF